MKKAVLHVGFHKTGTTSIQYSLAKYNDGHTIYADLGDNNHSIALCTLFEESNLASYWTNMGLKHEGHVQLVTKFKEQLTREMSKSFDRVMFSAEDVSNLTSNDLQRLKMFLEEFCNSIEIVVFVRNPREVVSSYFQQHVVAGQINWLRALDTYPFSFAEKIQKLFDVFGREQVRLFRYEDAMERSEGDIVKFFCSNLELDQQYTLQAGWQNRSICDATFKLLWMLFSSGLLNNNGAFLELVRKDFVWQLDQLVSKTFPKKISADQFEFLIDHKDLESLNHYLDVDYAQVRKVEGSLSQESRLGELDQLESEQLSRIIAEHLEEMRMPVSQTSSLIELLTIFYYRVMIDVGRTYFDQTQREEESPS